MIDMLAAIERARAAAGLSQRDLAAKTGISQATLNRILRGERALRMPEIILIAGATGCTVDQLTGEGVANRVMFAECSGSDNREAMRERMLHFMELDAYLDDQVIPEVMSIPVSSETKARSAAEEGGAFIAEEWSRTTLEAET